MEELKKEIEIYARACGITPSTASLRAVNDGKFYSRLDPKKPGPGIATVERFKKYMAANPPKQSDAA